MKFTSAILVLLALDSAHGFVPLQYRSMMPTATTFAPAATTIHSQPLGLSSSDNGDEPRRSRLDGNTREPTEQDIATMDEMITKLADAKPYELPNAVRRAFRVVSSPRFFLRIAERTDSTTEETEKEKLSALATNLVSTIEAVMSTAEDRLDDIAKDVEAVVKAASEPSGEFLVPLTPERVTAMRAALQDLDPSSLDEGFLSTVDAWMNKSHQDGMDGMVTILQKVLQIFAGTQISRAREQPETDRDSTRAAALFETLLNVDTDFWDMEIENGLQKVSSSELMGEVQRTIENVVLGLENGSMAQRVQAEFLRELITRIEAFQKKESSS